MRALALVAMLLGAHNAFASGADDLFNVAGRAAPMTNAATPGSDFSQFKLKDPFSVQFFSVSRSERSLPYDVGVWADRILKGQYAAAAHVWTAIQGTIPENFAASARAAHLYCLWSLGLSQTFFDGWFEAIRSQAFRETVLGRALEQTIASQ